MGTIVKSIIWILGMFLDISLFLDTHLSCRITAAWCQIHDVPIEKIFSKTLITKCTSLFLVLPSASCSHSSPSPLGDGSRARLEVLINCIRLGR